MSIWNAVPSGQSLGETRADLLGIHFALNAPCSCGCGSLLQEPVHLHHGILPKAKWRYVSEEHYDIRDHPVNLFIINGACHDRIGGARYFWKLACERYGKKAVHAWYRAAAGVFKSRLEDYS